MQDEGVLLVLRVRGELDLSTVEQVQQAVERHCVGRGALVVDLRELEFLDSTGLGLLLGLQRRQDGTAVAFTEPVARRVVRVLDMAGVRRLLHWVEDPGDALT